MARTIEFIRAETTSTPGEDASVSVAAQVLAGSDAQSCEDANSAPHIVRVPEGTHDLDHLNEKASGDERNDNGGDEMSAPAVTMSPTVIQNRGACDIQSPQMVSVEYIPVSAPLSDEQIALASDSSLEAAKLRQRKMTKGSLEYIPAQEPQAVAHEFDSSLHAAKSKESKMAEQEGITPRGPAERGAGSGPLAGAIEFDNTLEVAAPADSNAVSREVVGAEFPEEDCTPCDDTKISVEGDDGETQDSLPEETTLGSVTVSLPAASLATRDDFAADIHIPEATLVPPEEERDIPEATVVRPEKYSVTIAGRRIPLYLVVLFICLILVMVIALAVTLSDGGGGVQVIAGAPSVSPTVSFFPTMTPSAQPSTGPTSALQAQIVDAISNYSGGSLSTSFADARSNHQRALGWLVSDLSRPRNEEEALSEAEIVERFVLALLYFETFGAEWFNSFDFMTEEHVCRWRGTLFRTLRKGVTRCTPDRLIQNLTLGECWHALFEDMLCSPPLNETSSSR